MNKSENIWFSAVFEEYRNETLARDGLKKLRGNVEIEIHCSPSQSIGGKNVIGGKCD